MRRWEAVLHPREEAADRKGTPAYLAHRPSGMNQPSLWGWAWALLPRAAIAHTPWKEDRSVTSDTLCVNRSTETARLESWLLPAFPV